MTTCRHCERERAPSTSPAMGPFDGLAPCCLDAPSGPHLRGHRAFLTSPRGEAKWLKTASPYHWPLWWQPRRPNRVKVETLKQLLKRQLSGKPKDYTWKIAKTVTHMVPLAPVKKRRQRKAAERRAA